MWQCKVELLLQVGVSYSLVSGFHSLPSLWTKASWEYTRFPLLCMGVGGVTPPSENPTTLLPNPFNTALPSYNLRGGQAYLISSLHWRLSPPEALK